jgi:hypothetical protein
VLLTTDLQSIGTPGIREAGETKLSIGETDLRLSNTVRSCTSNGALVCRAAVATMTVMRFRAVKAQLDASIAGYLRVRTVACPKCRLAYHLFVEGNLGQAEVLAQVETLRKYLALVCPNHSPRCYKHAGPLSSRSTGVRLSLFVKMLHLIGLFFTQRFTKYGNAVQQEIFA